MNQQTTKLTPLKPLGTVDKIFDIDCVTNKEDRQKHIDSAVARNLPLCAMRKRRQGKLAIVASGPSVADCVDLLKDWKGEIWGVNGAFGWMRHRGIKPDAFIGIDPEWFLKDYLDDAPGDATYYLAAQVHPCVFDHLEGKNVRLWFQADGEIKLPPGAEAIHGGSSCVGRAPNLAWVLGWRDVHIFGADSSFTHKTHVYGGELPSNVIPAELGERMFKSTRTMMSQACEFVEQMVEWARGHDPLSVTLYGDGLMQELYKQTLQSGSYEQYLYEDWERNHTMNRKQRRAMR